jgi:hypothetical protein
MAEHTRSRYHAIKLMNDMNQGLLTKSSPPETQLRLGRRRTKRRAMVAFAIVLFTLVLVVALPGCSVNGRPMRAHPQKSPGVALAKAQSWFIEGKTPNGIPISCSFVEFDERGDFLDFGQHLDCQSRLRDLADSGRLMLVIYCHGWKNSSQSGDVADFNAFLVKLAASEEIQRRGLRVHGVYLGWRGNAFRPYVDKGRKNESYHETLAAFGEPIVAADYHRRFYWTGFIPETFSYWNRKKAAEDKVSGLPMARAIFTYAATAKDYGKKMTNRVFVMGHSFGALMLEQSLGQAMTGALTMEWWDTEKKGETPAKPGLPFDLVLFVNSAAPAIYAKEMRDFLKAQRSGLAIAHSPEQDVPVIVSVTSTADSATGLVHPIGNWFAPFAPSLQRRYTIGIFGDKQTNGLYPTHKGIRQSEFYTRTPGHQRYLINHWIVKEDVSLLPKDTSADAIFTANLSTNKQPDVFFTSKARHPASVWRLTTKPQGKPVKLGDLTPSMPDSNYWIVSCGEELIGGHNDVWSTTTMEMYAAIFRAVESRRGSKP